MRYVALLRGVNVGGKNRVAMPALVTLLEQFGCTSVRTYLQSGNVVFSWDSALAPELPALLTLCYRRPLWLPRTNRAADGSRDPCCSGS